MLIFKKKDDILCSKLSDILIKSLDYLNMYKMCCQDTVKIDDFEDQCIIFNLSKCVKLDPLYPIGLIRGSQSSYIGSLMFKTVPESVHDSHMFISCSLDEHVNDNDNDHLEISNPPSTALFASAEE